jgi:hypothetical protein
MPLDRARADDEPRADLRVGVPAAGQPRDLRLLRGQLVERLRAAPAHRLAGGQQLALRALGEGLHPDLGEDRMRGGSCSRASTRRPWRRSHSP